MEKNTYMGPAEGNFANIPNPILRTKLFTFLDVLMLIWLIGFMLFLIYQFAGYLLFKKKTLRWSRVPSDVGIQNTFCQISRDMEFKRNITLLISKNVTGPLMIGFSMPLLFLPKEDYSDKELNYILRHELTHYKRLDIWYKLFLIIVNGIHWFNPFIYLMFHEACADLELSCDDSVIIGLPNDERKTYSETLLASITTQQTLKTALSTYFYGGQKIMKSRFANIFNTKRKGKGAIPLIAVMLALGILGGVVSCSVNTGENKLLTKLGYTKKFLKDVIDNKTVFSEDNEHLAGIVESLPLQSYRKYKSFSLQTEPVKVINIVYEFDDSYTRGGNGLDPFPDIVKENNVLLLFAAVEGLEEVNLLHYDGNELNRTDIYTLTDLIPRFGKVNPQNMGVSDLYKALASNIQLSEFYFAHYSRIYLGLDPERVSYRNGEPAEIRRQPDGSFIWVYTDFSKIYSLSPDGPNNAPENTAFYYFNSPTAEKNDDLTGLYATRFVHDENYGRTYVEITEVLGLPTTVKNMGGKDKYIAYSLAEGQQRNAYFIFHDGKVTEEGVMYGNDYTTL